MKHDPTQHFTDEQIDVITNIFDSKINSLLLKTIGAYIITVLLCAFSVGGAWFKLVSVEDSVANISDAVHQSLPSKEYVDTADTNIKASIEVDRKNTTERLDRIEDKLDEIINKL